MQKKLIAMAVAGIVAAPAFAQTSTVVVYGRANVGFDNYQATGATAGSAFDWKARNRVFDYGSNIGFKGKEDLGNGLNANFVMESGVNFDTGSANGQGGTANASTGTLASRSSYLALGGAFGEIRAGRQDVHWLAGRTNFTGSNELGLNGPIGSGGGGMVGGPAYRTPNVLMYVSPTTSGFNAQVGYIANGELAPVGVDVNGKGWTLNLNYNNGPIAVKYDYTVMEAQNAVSSPATGAAKNTGNKLILGYFYQGASHVGLTFNQDKHENSAAVGTIVNAGDDLKQNSWLINWEHNIGNFRSLVSFGQAGSVSGMNGATANSGETKYSEFTLAGMYFFSKRTHGYVEYSKITNKSQAYADYTGGGITSAGSGLTIANAGADPRIIGVGLSHFF